MACRPAPDIAGFPNRDYVPHKETCQSDSVLAGSLHEYWASHGHYSGFCCWRIAARMLGTAATEQGAFAFANTMPIIVDS
jgi:hypothetical protein